MLENLISRFRKLPSAVVYGRITEIKNFVIKCKGIKNFVGLGSRCRILGEGINILAQVIAIDDNEITLMTNSMASNVNTNCLVEVLNECSEIYPDESWLGRIIDAENMPMDHFGVLKYGDKPYSLYANAPKASTRYLSKEKFDIGVKSINTFLTCSNGQRIGIFSASGIGKSSLVSMITKFAKSDVKIIGLIGERGIEVQEFINKTLDKESLKQSIVVVSTSNDAPILRKRAAYLVMSLAEYFREKGKNVLCIIDSLTRFAYAEREIGLALGEPITSRGYTSGVFSELPKLLERAGPGINGYGNITGIFSILVEGDDHNEPISDTVRSIIDGHIVLDRKIAESGLYPAIDILRSISRVAQDSRTSEENELVLKARKYIASYKEMEDLIKLGIYKKGADSKLDEAIFYYSMLEKFLSQCTNEYVCLEDSFLQLKNIISTKI